MKYITPDKVAVVTYTVLEKCFGGVLVCVHSNLGNSET